MHHTFKVEELVKALDSPSGWTRDTAQQLLILRGKEEEARSIRRKLLDILEGVAPTRHEQALVHALGVLDGLDRLCSVEGPQLDWAESLHVLRRALRPGGSLLLSVENELGVHRLVDRSSVTSAHTDGAWVREAASAYAAKQRARQASEAA